MSGLTLGYFWSILVMMGAPFLMVGGVAFFIWRAVRAADRRHPAAPPPGA